MYQIHLSKKFLWGMAGMVLALLIFKAGILVGYHKAGFSYRWGESYHRNFAGPRRGFFRDFHDRDFISAHGTFGEILSIDGAKLVVRGRDNVEKIISTDQKTMMQRGRDAVRIQDLHQGDFIVTIGSPNNEGQIEAKFIRLIPPPRNYVQKNTASSTSP